MSLHVSFKFTMTLYVQVSVPSNLSYIDNAFNVSYVTHLRFDAEE